MSQSRFCCWGLGCKLGDKACCFPLGVKFSGWWFTPLGYYNTNEKEGCFACVAWRCQDCFAIVPLCIYFSDAKYLAYPCGCFDSTRGVGFCFPCCHKNEHGGCCCCFLINTDRHSNLYFCCCSPYEYFRASNGCRTRTMTSLEAHQHHNLEPPFSDFVATRQKVQVITRGRCCWKRDTLLTKPVEPPGKWDPDLAQEWQSLAIQADTVPLPPPLARMTLDYVHFIESDPSTMTKNNNSDTITKIGCAPATVAVALRTTTQINQGKRVETSNKCYFLCFY